MHEYNFPVCLFICVCFAVIIMAVVCEYFMCPTVGTLTVDFFNMNTHYLILSYSHHKMASSQSALEKDTCEVSIDEIKTELFKKLHVIQEGHDELKQYADSYIDTVPARTHAQKFGVKLEELIDKIEEIKEFYAS